jgi:uncharacterized repeat protein (TIGR03833 family)
VPDYSGKQPGTILNKEYFMGEEKRGKHRDAITIGLAVDIVQKADQRSGKLTRGRVQEILTGSSTHPHGIKVRLEDGRVGRVAAIIAKEADGTKDGKRE